MGTGNREPREELRIFAYYHVDALFFECIESFAVPGEVKRFGLLLKSASGLQQDEIVDHRVEFVQADLQQVWFVE